jgi:PilZ domain
MAESIRSEQRGSPRIAVALDVSLGRKVGNDVHATTSDLSISGACITCSRPLRVDEEVRFDMELPLGAHLGGKARVLRQQRHDTYALRFEHLSPATRGALGEFVASPPLRAPSTPI